MDSDPTVILRLIFYGLVAFVVDEPKKPDYITALLLDGSAFPHSSDGCPMPAHRAQLIYEKAASCGSSLGCRERRGLCICPITGQDVGFSASGFQGCEDKSDKKPCSYDALSYLVKMKEVKSRANRINPAFLFDQLLERESELLAARVLKIGINQSPEVCRMIDDGHTHSASSGVVQDSHSHYTFRSLVDTTMFPHSQDRLAEAILIPTKVKGKMENGVVKVDINLQPFDAPRPFPPLSIGTYKCGKDGGEHCADLIIVNLMEDVHHVQAAGRCKSHAVGRHFEIYYDLANEIIYHDQKRVPRQELCDRGDQCNVLRKRSHVEPCESSLFPQFEDFLRLRAGENRPICPMPVVSQ